MEPRAANTNCTTRLVSNDRCVNNRWKPTVTPTAVRRYIPTKSARYTQLKPQPHNKVQAATRPASGAKTAKRLSRRVHRGSGVPVVSDAGNAAAVPFFSGVETDGTAWAGAVPNPSASGLGGSMLTTGSGGEARS